MSGGTEGPRDWLGILLGRGRRRPHNPKPGCFFPCLLVLASAAAGLVAAAHTVTGYL